MRDPGCSPLGVVSCPGTRLQHAEDVLGSSVLSREKGRIAEAPSHRPFNEFKTAALVLATISVPLVLGAFIAGQPFQLEVTRCTIVAIAALIVCVAAARFRNTVSLLRRLFWARDSATNLALLRIATFSALWWLLCSEPIVRAMAYREVWTVPQSIGWLFTLVPPEESLVRAGVEICKLLCLFGILGVFTRTNAALCALAGIYLIGIAASLKVDHCHHVIWFLLILSVARSSDRLSLAAAIGQRSPHPERSLQYGVPLRMAWLLIGIIYFFPGLFKLWTTGIDWIWTDNMSNVIMSRTFPFRTAAFQTSPPPVVWQIGALLAVLFETTFVVLLFLGDKARTALAATALLFHRATGIVMNINFYHLQFVLPVLVNWHRLFLLVGRRLFGRRWLVRFSPTCNKCLALRSALSHFDVLRRIAPTFAESSQQTTDYHAGDHSLAVAWQIVARAPLVALPAGCLSFEHRHSQRPAPPVSRMSGSPLWSLVIGATIAVVQCGYGFSETMDDWPFACYPLFHRRQREQITVCSAELEKSDGTYESVWMSSIDPALGKARILAMINHASHEGADELRKSALILCRMACLSNPDWQAIESIYIFNKTIRLDVHRPKGELIQSEPLFSFSGEELLLPQNH